VGRIIYISGGTGYLGASLIPRLCKRGHFVRALCRPGSEQKLARYADPVTGNALDASTFSPAGFDTFVHLVGTPHPAPWKGEQFRAIDFVSLKASIEAAKLAMVSHFVYVSVAHPAPVMKSYIEVRAECERIVVASGIPATILRPWYVLGPGHWWPGVLKPAYWLCEHLPPTSSAARRLGLVSLQEMVDALTWSIENPPCGTMVLEVPEIRHIANTPATGVDPVIV
jgi:uncharacterized protein YbjT (DUF2867 family)